MKDLLCPLWLTAVCLSGVSCGGGLQGVTEAPASADSSAGSATPTAATRAVAITGAGSTAIWPQWRGPKRDGRSAETGLAKQWPEAGPPLLWHVDGIGDGYASAAIAGGAVYVTGMVQNEGRLTALDLDGNRLWQVPYGREWHRARRGSRSTPTVLDGRVYLVSAFGEVGCFDAATGARLWQVDATRRFGSRQLDFGYAESLVVDDRYVYVTPGGVRASVVALDRDTGETRWIAQGLDEAAAYCSPLLFEHGGRDILTTHLAASFVGIEADTGVLLWRHPYDDYHARPERRFHTDHPNTPLFHDGGLFTTSGYGDGSALTTLAADGASASRTWADWTLDVQHGGAVLVDGHVFGSSMQGEEGGHWTCVEWASGKVAYDMPWNGYPGAVIYADGMLIVYEERTGKVGLVPATPDRFAPVSSFAVPHGQGEHWAHPALAGGRLYLRHGDALMAHDVRAAAP